MHDAANAWADLDARPGTYYGDACAPVTLEDLEPDPMHPGAWRRKVPQ
jgi:hypothetical protein